MSPALASEPRILVIRGGALGDFILTLPAIRLLRESFASARLEIFGYKHILELADGRFYADATRSIEYGPVAAFFARNAVLDPELSEYFASFQQVISYLFDPDGIFEANLRRAGVKNILQAFRKIDDSDGAARQLARPLEQLALYLDDARPQIFPNSDDLSAAKRVLEVAAGQQVVALHPGSGSLKKNWPVDRWLQTMQALVEEQPKLRLLIVGGEADRAALQVFEQLWRGEELLFARDLPLPHLGAVLQQCFCFFGHDSGISHLAAAVGAKCLLLFGPTDPDVWKPANEGVVVVQVPGGDFSELGVATVVSAARKMV